MDSGALVWARPSGRLILTGLNEFKGRGKSNTRHELCEKETSIRLRKRKGHIFVPS